MKTYTECYQSQEITEQSNMCCSGKITTCPTCKRKMCEYHGDTFSHCLTCRTPEENEKLLEKYGLKEKDK